MRGPTLANPFERRVAAKGGGYTILRLSEAEVSATLATLRENAVLMDLAARYRQGLDTPSDFPEAAEIALRQRIFPVIDAELCKIDPTFHIFSAGILDRLLLG